MTIVLQLCYCQPNVDSGRRQLRSADANVLSVPRTRSRLGDRSFSVAGPRVWNSLPVPLRQPDIEFGQFKRLLKSFLFGEIAAHLWLFLVFNVPCISWFTYLLTDLRWITLLSGVLGLLRRTLLQSLTWSWYVLFRSNSGTWPIRKKRNKENANTTL